MLPFLNVPLVKSRFQQSRSSKRTTDQTGIGTNDFRRPHFLFGRTRLHPFVFCFYEISSVNLRLCEFVTRFLTSALLGLILSSE